MYQTQWQSRMVADSHAAASDCALQEKLWSHKGRESQGLTARAKAQGCILPA